MNYIPPILKVEEQNIKSYRVHKTRGTVKIVNVEAERCSIEGGCLIFYVKDKIVMAYSPWAWKTVQEEGRPEEEVL